MRATSAIAASAARRACDSSSAPSTSSCVEAIAGNVNGWRRIAPPSLRQRLERLADAALDPARRERQDVGAPVAAQAPLALLPVEVDAQVGAPAVGKQLRDPDRRRERAQRGEPR